MPFGNGRGPAGMGPMTGRAAGFCAGYSLPGYANPIQGRGLVGPGFGRGGGRGRRRWFYATGLTGWQRGVYGHPYGPYYDPNPAPYSQPVYSKEDHLNDLKQHAQYLKGMLEDIKNQINAMETSTRAE